MLFSHVWKPHFAGTKQAINSPLILTLTSRDLQSNEKQIDVLKKKLKKKWQAYKISARDDAL